jgi:hypothetical protein
LIVAVLADFDRLSQHHDASQYNLK